MKEQALLPMPLVAELMFAGYEFAIKDLERNGKLQTKEEAAKAIAKHLEDGIAKGEIAAVHQSQLNTTHISKKRH